jgi:hypothetical protein
MVYFYFLILESFTAYDFFSKNIVIPNVAEKNILILVEEKNSEFLSYNLMLNSGKNFSHFARKKINNLTLVLSEKKILNETKKT